VQLAEQGQRHGIVRFEARGELVEQPCLVPHQRLLIARERLEFTDQRAVGLQAAQIGQVTTPGAGQQVGVQRVGLGAGRAALAIKGARRDRIDGESRLDQGADQQPVRGLHEAGHLLVPARRAHERHQGLQALHVVRHAHGAHPPSVLIDHDHIMVFVGPVNSSVAHPCLLPSN